MAQADNAQLSSWALSLDPVGEEGAKKSDRLKESIKERINRGPDHP
jgi:hypothetical protein